MKKISMCSTLNKSTHTISGFIFVRPNWSRIRGLSEDHMV